jgi:hypothetical protein
MSDSNRQIGDGSIIGMGVVLGALLGYAFNPGFAQWVDQPGLRLGVAVGGGTLLGAVVGWVVTHLKR